MTDIEKSAGVSNPLILIQAAIEKGIDPERLGKLLDLQERWEANQAAKQFAYAIQEFQKEMPPVIKGNPVYGRDESKGPQYYFADFDDILTVAQPFLSKHGIVPTFTMVVEGTTLKTTCRIRVGTHFEETTVPLGLPTIPNANDSQRAGAALSYGKRYSLCAALNIRVKGEDRDGCGLDGLKDSQVAELNTLFEQCRLAGNPVDAPRFWAYIGCKDMNDLPASKFELAKFELTRKRTAKPATKS